MNKFDTKKAELIKSFKGLEKREVYLMAITLSVVVFSIIYYFFINPAYTKNIHLKKEIVAKEQQAQRLEQTVKLLEIKKNNDPNDQVKNKIKTLTTKKQLLINQLSERSESLAKPEEIVFLVRSLLSENTDIELLNFENKPAELIKLNEDKQSSLYKHILQIEVKANYQAMMNYLASLKDLSKKIFWQKFDYEIIKYPNGNLYIEIFAVSTHEELING